MSHSVVKVTQAPVDDSVVVVVGEDGSVSLDRETLESLLQKPSALNVVHVNEADGPTIDVTIDRIEMQRDAVDELILETDEATRNYSYIRMEHDYTPLTSPSQVKTTEEIENELGMDELAQTLSMMEGTDENESESPSPPKSTQQQQHVVRVRQKPTVVGQNQQQQPVQRLKMIQKTTGANANRTITVQKTVVTNKNGKKILTRVAPQAPLKKVPQKINANSKQQKFIVSDDAMDDIEEEESEDEDFELDDDDIDSDDNSDEDFEEALLRAKHAKKTYGGRKRRSTEGIVKTKKTKTKSHHQPHQHYGGKVSHSVPTPPTPPVEAKPPPEETKLTPPATESPVKKPPPKKEKKIPKPIIDDGIALFSTPDIIRRVGGSKPDAPESSSPKTPKPAKVGHDGRMRSSSEKSTNKTPRTSIEAKSPSTPKRSISTDSKPEKALVGRVEIQNSVSIEERDDDDEDDSMMDTLEPLPSAEDIRAIIHTDAKSFTTSLVLNESSPSAPAPTAAPTTPSTPSVTEPKTPQQQHILQQEQPLSQPTPIENAAEPTIPASTVPATEDVLQVQAAASIDQGSINLETAGLEIDQAILDNISPEELISEDILYQVAKLVENTDIQTVIDRSFTDASIVLPDGASDTGSQVMNVVSGASSSVSGVSSVTAPVAAVSQVVGEPISTTSLASVSSATSVPPTSSTSSIVMSNQAKEGNATLKNTITIRQIVRPDGRVVNLPPIEKPATRSANKKKNVDDDKESPMSKIIKAEMESLDEEEAAPIVVPIVGPVGDDEEAADTDSDESWNSEDDPDRLWCICKQPHNNRFMICCDTCEDWFHGKCVNVTKAMGQQMEEEGRDWICPNCIKKKNSGEEIQKPLQPLSGRPMPSITPAQRRRSKVDSEGGTSPKGSVSRRQSAEGSAPSACIVCGNPSRSNSIYCSDQCILKHAQGVERVVVFERATGKILSGSNAPSAANAKQWLAQHPGFELVRTSSNKVFKKMTQSKLKLVKNTGEQGGVSLAVQRKGVPIGVLKHAPKGAPGTPTFIKKGGQKFQVITKHVPVSGSPKQIKLINPVPLQRVQTVPGTVAQQNAQQPAKQVKVVQTNVKSFTLPKMDPKPSLNATTKIVRQVSKTEQSTPSKDNSQSQETIRESVRKTLAEHLNARLKGNASKDVTLTADEVTKLSTEIETQLYKLFGATGPKYRAKYRSLTFNIKDPKNQTLWRRICEKSITPAQLVKLSPDDLASQELALWRERENKHQLDMIKKTELELLQCNRTYVLKTHKGEEVMEERRPTSTVDSTEVVAALGPDTSDSKAESTKDSKDLSESRRSRSSERKSSSSKHSRRDKHHSRHSSKDRSSRKDRRSSSKDRRKRSRSRDRSSHRDKKKDSRDRDRDKHRRSSSHKSSRHKKESSHSAREELDKKSKEILEQLVDKNIVPPLEDRLWKHVPQEDIVQTGTNTAESDSDHEPTSTVTIPTPPRSTDPEEAVKRTSHDESKRSPIEMSIKQEKLSPDEIKVEPKLPSTPSPDSYKPIKEDPELALPTVGIEAWKGTINMVDVAQISITAHIVSGDTTTLFNELSLNLDIVGRISPDTVWDYISKMKCSNSKTITILRLNATNMEEKMPYIALYSYLSSRNRLGVVKCTNKQVKDFYILPLATDEEIPQALLPLNGSGLGEEPRPPLLVGIIVRTKKRRAMGDAGQMPVSKKTKVEVRIATPPTHSSRSYTPPPTAEKSMRIDPRIKNTYSSTTPSAPRSNSSISEDDEDDDEPYSPKDSDVEALPAEATPTNPLINLDLNNLSAVLTTTKTMYEAQVKVTTQPFQPFTKNFDSIPGLGDEIAEASASSLDIERKMAEMDKLIETKKREIHNMSLANIALPSNLQQILDSIKGISPATPDLSEEYSPSAPSFSKAESDLTIPLLLPKISSRSSRTSTPPVPHLTQKPIVTAVPPPVVIPSVPPPTVTAPPPAPAPSEQIILPDLTVPPPNLIPPPTIPLNLPKSVKSTKPVEKVVPPPVVVPEKPAPSSSSVLSSLSEEELIRKAAEMLGEAPKEERAPSPKEEKELPPPGTEDEVPPGTGPGPSLKFSPAPTAPKRAKIDLNQPPIPGLEDF